MSAGNLGIVLLILALLLVGCRSAPADGVLLEGKEWRLVSLGEEPPLTDTAPSAEFSEGQIAGSAGCNHYFGVYAVKGDSIAINDVGWTEMYCTTPEGVMDQEEAFLTALIAATNYRFTGEQLELLDAEGSMILTFEPQSGAP